MGPTKFTIRLLNDPRKIAVQALSAGLAESKMPTGTTSLLTRLRKGTGLRMTEDFDPREAAILLGALTEYAESHLREGGRAHAMAIGLAQALGDVVATADGQLEQAARELEEAVQTEALPRLAAIDAVFTERTREQRDAMLRAVFAGGPRKKVNIWGQVVDAESDG